jgi:hypothetical protein
VNGETVPACAQKKGVLSLTLSHVKPQNNISTWDFVFVERSNASSIKVSNLFNKNIF